MNAQRVKVTSSNDENQSVYSSNGQHELISVGKVFVGAGASYGFFYPSAVNEFLNDIYSNYILTQGVYDIFMNYTLRASLGTQLSDYFCVRGELSYSVAPKFITTNIRDELYSLNRLSPGVIGEVLIPVSSFGNYLFGGAMLNFNYFTFEGYNASSFGGQLRGGVRWLGTDKFFFDVFIAIDAAKGATKSFAGPTHLSYNGAQFGVTGYLNIAN